MKVKREGCLACNGTNKVDGDFLYLLAYKHSIQRREDIPESVRQLAIPLIQRFIMAIRNIAGTLELAARRGVSEEEIKKSYKAMKEAREEK